VWSLVEDRVGSAQHRFASAGETSGFAEAAVAAGPGSEVIEYSFAEARFWPDAPENRADPGGHFRSPPRPRRRGSGAGGGATIAWLDGHVAAGSRTRTWASGVYGGDAEAAGIGWTGERDDNSLYDYE